MKFLKAAESLKAVSASLKGMVLPAFDFSGSSG
jgi:hypothetical protein